MATTSPARIDDDLYASAKLAAEVQSRSTSQQVVHWARIGREIEASSSISSREIAEVLAGSRPYDDLGPRAQAVVRSEWATRMDDRREALDLAEQFAAEGRTWVELDDGGAVVQRGGAIADSTAALEPDRAAGPRTAARSARPGKGSRAAASTKPKTQTQTKPKARTKLTPAAKTAASTGAAEAPTPDRKGKAAGRKATPRSRD